MTGRFHSSLAARLGMAWFACFASATFAGAALAQSRPLTIRTIARPAPVRVAPRPMFDATASRSAPNYAWAAMATTPVWSYNERFNGPLDRRLFVSGAGRAMFFF